MVDSADADTPKRPHRGRLDQVDSVHLQDLGASRVVGFVAALLVVVVGSVAVIGEGSVGIEAASVIGAVPEVEAVLGIKAEVGLEDAAASVGNLTDLLADNLLQMHHLDQEVIAAAAALARVGMAVAHTVEVVTVAALVTVLVPMVVGIAIREVAAHLMTAGPPIVVGVEALEIAVGIRGLPVEAAAIGSR